MGVILIQICAACFVAWSYYMVAMMMTTYDGFPSFFFQPFIGALFAAVAVLVCFLIGLPLRIIPGLRRSWQRFWFLPLFLGSIGFLLMVFSWLPPFREVVYDEDLRTQVKSFQPALALSGYLLSVFAALHFRFPRPRFMIRKSAATAICK